jgi:hypothetical protein
LRVPDRRWLGLAAALLLTQVSCVPLPVRIAPGVSGVVVDATTGKAIDGAIVVVRFDGRYGEVLPDRDYVAHVEATSGSDGSFRIDRFARAGMTVWPLYEVEARVVGVMRDGYRCPAPISVPDSHSVRIEITAALDADDRRDSCRPLASRRGEALAYMEAWRKLFPSRTTPEERERERQVDRMLEARAALGFGENCEGPVHDLALAPGGNRAAFVAEGAGGREVDLVSLSPQGAASAKVVAKADDTPPRRLAWTSADELVLWQPSRPEDRAISPSIFAPGHAEVVWTTSRALPAAIDRGTPASSQRTSTQSPLEPEDLSDEAESMWLGRSFALERELDPATGLSHDRLRVVREDGSRYDLALPGEACGGPRFGRPQYRIGAGGRIALDLRWVDDGCHAVQLDLESGSWSRIDGATAAATCRAQRSIPPGQLSAALRGWMRDLESALSGAGADTGAAYVLNIGPGGATEVRARDLAGDPLVVKAARFPIATPLQRIDVTTVAPAMPGSRLVPPAPAQGIEPL